VFQPFSVGGVTLKQPSVVVIGAATLDMKGRPKMPIVEGTSNPGYIRVSPGGVGRNVAENLARLGVPTVLLSAVGDDSAGRQILDATGAGGVDVSRVIVSSEFPSASYLTIIDEHGNPLLSIDDMQIMELVTPKYIYAQRTLISNASMLVLDANLSPRAVKSAVSIAARWSVPVCVDPVSVAVAPRISPYLTRIFLAIPNEDEAALLCGLPASASYDATVVAQQLVSMGVNIAIITLAEKGLVYATSQERGHVPAISIEVVDPTGGGDALTGAVVFGLVNGFSISEAVRLGVSAASLTLTSTYTVCPDLSLERLYDRLVI
jgi:pseudouridine kinase